MLTFSHSVSDIQHSRRRWKCSAHLLWTGEVSPILHALHWLCLSSPSLFIYHVLPTSYGLVRFCCSAAFSVLVARAMKQSFLPSLFNCQCLDVRSVFLACSSQTFISSFRHFLLVLIKDYLSLDIHSSRLLALLPRRHHRSLATSSSVSISDCQDHHPHILRQKTCFLLYSWTSLLSPCTLV